MFSQKEYDKDSYLFYKGRGRCTHCGKKDAYTMNGKTRCFECSEKQREYDKQNRFPENEHYKSALNRMQEKRERWRLDGKCIECGKPAAQGRVRCEKHLATARNRTRKYRESIRTDGMKSLHTNVCRNCGAAVSDGEKFCDACYDERLRRLERARAKQKARREEHNV